MTADLDLDALAALDQAATPGPWRVVYDNEIHAEGQREVVSADLSDDDECAVLRLRDSDAALIAAMRNALPALIAAAERVSDLDQDRNDWRTVALNYELERDAVRAELADLRERVERVVEALEELTVPCNGPGCPGCTAGRLRAALTTGGDDD